MLLAIRERAKGWIAWVVIILIGAAFALFGLSSYIIPSGAERAVATVNGEEINPDAVSRMYQQQRRQIEQILGDQFDPSMIDDRELRLEALNQVIDEYLMSEFIESQRLRLSDRDLAAVIRSQEMFHENGRFSSARYHQLLDANRMSSAQHESQVRRGALMGQVQAAIAETAVVTERDMQELIALQQQEREVSYLTISSDDFRDPESVSDEDVRAYYEENKPLFVSPEQVKLAWVELRRDALLDAIQIDDDALRERYEQVADSRFSERETRQVRHILVQVDNDADVATEEEARERIEDLRSRISGGEEFADVAMDASEDPGSARRGGDLGTLERGLMVEAFADVAFSLDQGVLSDPVRSSFGFHLIEVTEVIGGERQPFDEVRDVLRKELAEERVNNLFFDRSNELGQLVFEWPDSLDSAADALDLEVQSTDWIPRDGASSGIGRHPEVMTAAMSSAVLEDGYNSDLIQLSNDRYVVVRVTDHATPEQLEFAEVADEARELLLEQRAQEIVEARSEELMVALRDASSIEDVASDAGFRLENAGFIGRDADLSRQVIRQAFEMGRPADGQRSVGLTRLSNGRYSLVVVSAVRDGDPSVVSGEERAQLREQLRNTYGQHAIQDFLRELRAQADVEIFEDRLQSR